MSRKQLKIFLKWIDTLSTQSISQEEKYERIRVAIKLLAEGLVP